MASSSPIEIKSSPPPAGLKIKLNAGLAKREPSAGTSSAGARDVIEIDDSEPDEVANGVKTEQAKVRHEADLKKHHYEPPKADRVQDDWQVAYVWAFIMKFHQIERIRKLESIHDFERCLMEPVANRPDDVLEGILIRFLSNLKPGLRNLDCTNIQHHLSAYVTDQLLNSNEFTVWDRPWAPNEEARGSCCTNARDREELGRLRYAGEPASERAGKNPIAQVEQRGGGLFELDWRERTKLLRQLVDWQLAHAESIKPVINIEYKLDAKGAKKVTTATTANDPEESIVTIPLGQDRDKNRIWAFDHSGRLYKSGNPFKRPCPLVAISTTRAEFDVQLQEYQAHGAQKPEKPKGSGVKGKMSKQETVMYRKLLKGIEDEKQLAAKVEELVPLIEKEEARIQRARKRIAAANELAQMAEVRSTRTRRTTRKVDYTYDGDEEEPEDNKRSKGNNGDWEGSSTRGRLVIPGERRSARTSGRGSNGQDDGASDAAEIEEVTEQRRNGTDGDHTMTASGSGSLDLEDVEGFVSAPAAPAAIGAAGKPKKAAAKGYAWVTEFVPESELTPKDRAALAKNSAATPGDGWANGHSSQEGAAAANPPEGQVNHGDPMEVKDGPPVIAEGPP